MFTPSSLLLHTDTTSSNSRKVTQLPNNVIQSYSRSGGDGVVDGTASQNSVWRGRGEHAAVDEEDETKRTRSTHQHNFMLSYGSGGGEVKTFISNGDVAMVAAAQQISHIRHSSENTSLSQRVLDINSNSRLSVQQQHRDEEVEKYTDCVRIMEKVHGGRATASIDCDIAPSSLSSSLSTDAGVISKLQNCNSSLPSQPLPSLSTCVQSQYRPEATHRNSADLHIDNSSSASSSSLQAKNFQFHVENENNGVDYYLRRNICARQQQPTPPHAIDVTTVIREREQGVKCSLVGVNSRINDENNRVNVNVNECNSFMSNQMNPKNINEQRHSDAVNNVKIFTSTEKCSNESTDNNNNPKDSFTGRKVVSKSDNLTTITSAIDNGSNHHAMMMMLSDKEKITPLTTSDVSSTSLSSVSKKEKRRRDRRDRRLARTRASGAPFYAVDAAAAVSEIAPDILHNHMPPPYADIPAQTTMVPSIVSTVPVEDNRYTFTLPLVRR